MRNTRLTLRVTLPARLLAVLRSLILLRITLLRGAGLSLLGLLPEVLRLVLHARREGSEVNLFLLHLGCGILLVRTVLLVHKAAHDGGHKR